MPRGAQATVSSCWTRPRKDTASWRRATKLGFGLLQTHSWIPQLLVTGAAWAETPAQRIQHVFGLTQPVLWLRARHHAVEWLCCTQGSSGRGPHSVDSTWTGLLRLTCWEVEVPAACSLTCWGLIPPMPILLGLTRHALFTPWLKRQVCKAVGFHLRLSGAYRLWQPLWLHRWRGFRFLLQVCQRQGSCSRSSLAFLTSSSRLAYSCTASASLSSCMA